MKNPRHTGLVLLALWGVGAGVAACGGSPSGSTTPSGQLRRADQAFLEFTACMRRHGVQMADPYHRSGHAGLTLDLPEKTPATTTAYSSCNHLITSIEAMKAAGMQARENGMSYQQRLARQHGAIALRPVHACSRDPDARSRRKRQSEPRERARGRRRPVATPRCSAGPIATAAACCPPVCPTMGPVRSK